MKPRLLAVAFVASSIGILAACGGAKDSDLFGTPIHPVTFTLIPQLTFYEILFAISAFLRLAAVVIFLPHIHEHGASGTREALRFMSANIYNNLFNAVLQPLRYLRVRSVYRDERT